MPIYEYECQDCKILFEIIVSSADAAKDITCRKCASRNVKKTISAGSHRLASGSSLPAAGCSSKSKFT